MGVLDEIEAVERARARGEPMGGRLRRRVAIVLLPIGIGLALLASWASAWHVYDFDVVGVGRAQVRVGLWDIEACPERGDCEPMPRAFFVDRLGVLGRTSDAALSDWLDARWQVGIGLFLSAAAAAVLIFCIAATQPFKLIRRLAIGAFAVGVVTLLLTLRSVLAEAVDFLGFGIAVYAALAALVFLLVGAALIAFGGAQPVKPAASESR